MDLRVRDSRRGTPAAAHAICASSPSHHRDWTRTFFAAISGHTKASHGDQTARCLDLCSPSLAGASFCLRLIAMLCETLLENRCFGLTFKRDTPTTAGPCPAVPLVVPVYQCTIEPPTSPRLGPARCREGGSSMVVSQCIIVCHVHASLFDAVTRLHA